MKYTLTDVSSLRSLDMTGSGYASSIGRTSSIKTSDIGLPGRNVISTERGKNDERTITIDVSSLRSLDMTTLDDPST